MTELETIVLKAVDSAPIENTYDWAAANKLDHDEVCSTVKSLWAREILAPKQMALQFTELSEEGQEVLKEGSPEARIFKMVLAGGDTGVTRDDLMAKFEKSVVGSGVGACLKSKWMKIADGKYIADAAKSDEVEKDAYQQLLKSDLSSLDAKTLKLLKKRKATKLIKITAFSVAKGEKFTLTPKRLHTEISLEMLNSGEWQTAEFKAHNFNSLGQPPAGGHLHPLLKVRAEYRQIFLEMGFTEMKTDRWVESSFWNFDALFQPQQHPARDAHDTFFVKSPANGPPENGPDEAYVERVRTMHQTGGQGSIGYRYKWALEEARKNILRTHTTAVSSRTLYELAQDFKPRKFFSIDRVFRNESMDATHLAEFHQIEGIIIGPDLTLGDLIGTIQEFFKRVGVNRVRFKPAYNPYTEPSMEIFAYHEYLQKWVEVGNSGMFRPEMLLPMGLPPNVRAIAWGLGLERPTMIKYGINNIRDLCGHKLDLRFVETNPACRLDK